MDSNTDLDLVFLIDRSGSMGNSVDDTIGGFNSYLKKEKENEFNTYVTTVLFDNEYEVLYKRKSIDEVEELTNKEYWVRGTTALLDAVGKTINSLNHEIDNKVLFIIMTDGYENASKEYSKEQIKNLIANHSRWEFIYIGADIDSYAEARSLGIDKSRVANYEKSKAGLSDVFCSIGEATSSYRMMGEVDQDWSRDLDKYD